jgi:GNAT superfamily N-acetyltransferase
MAVHASAVDAEHRRASRVRPGEGSQPPNASVFAEATTSLARVESVTFRSAERGDVEEIARTMELGFETYREFMPEGWAPPPIEHEPVRARLADPAIWCRVAEAHGKMAGHVALMPATLHGDFPDPDPTLAHLWQLFVREEYWGAGIATSLHSGAVEEAARRGFSTFRLFTPSAQARARRFYEREGWSPSAPPFTEEDWGGMELVEYRRPLP